MTSVAGPRHGEPPLFVAGAGADRTNDLQSMTQISGAVMT